MGVKCLREGLLMVVEQFSAWQFTVTPTLPDRTPLPHRPRCRIWKESPRSVFSQWL